MNDEPESNIKSANPIATIWNYIAMAFGAIFFIVGFGLLIREILFGQTAMPTVGKVVDIRVTDSGDGPNQFPIVEFTAAQGETVQFEGISTNPPPIHGEQVPVLYSPKDPKNARINTFFSRWIFPVVFTPVGLILLLAGFFQQRRKQNPQGLTAVFY